MNPFKPGLGSISSVHGLFVFCFFFPRECSKWIVCIFPRCIGEQDVNLRPFMCILRIHVVPLQIAATSDNSSLRTTVMEFCTEVTECGFTKAIPCITMDDKITLIQTMTLHHVLLRSKAEMDQFCEGLQALGVLNAVREYPDLMRPFFTNSAVQNLTAGDT